MANTKNRNTDITRGNFIYRAIYGALSDHIGRNNIEQATREVMEAIGGQILPLFGIASSTMGATRSAANLTGGTGSGTAHVAHKRVYRKRSPKWQGQRSRQARGSRSIGGNAAVDASVN